MAAEQQSSHANVMNPSTHLLVYYVLTTINTVADALIFEGWSILLVSSLILKLVALSMLLVWSTSTNNSDNTNDNDNTSSREERRWLSRWLWKAFFVMPLILSNIYWLDKMPFTWESDLWSVQIDTVVIIYAILMVTDDGDDHKGENTPSGFSCFLSWTVQDMYACYYTAAGFWKINSHFLDPTSSCATVFLCQHLASVAQLVGLEWEAQVSIAKFLAPTAPIGTVIVELSMGLGLIVGRIAMIFDNDEKHHISRYWTRIGLRTILFFHLAVCLTPQPNNISLFALQCACRLVLITNEEACEIVGRYLLGLGLATSKSKATSPSTTPPPYGLAILWVATVAVAYGFQREFTPLNWSFLFYVPVMIFLLLTLGVEAAREDRQRPQDVATSSKRPTWMTLACITAFFYSFGTIVLGTMEEASCNMFSNLKIHGGSGNHLVLPTGLLFDWYRDDVSHPFGGGEVRIVSTTSDWLQDIYPNDMSHILGPSPFALDLLTETMSIPPPAFLNPGANRVLGLREQGWVPAPPHGTFIPYSVPSLELKRLLKEAIERDRSFDVTYVHLPRISGDDEILRGTAWQRIIYLKIRHGGRIAKCKVQYKNGTKYDCQPSAEVPYQLDVPWFVEKVSMYHGYPVLYERDGKTPRKRIQCFGP